MIKICVVCGYPTVGNNETCTNLCLEKLKSRRAIALTDRRKVDAAKHVYYKPINATTGVIVGNFARILLEQDIPSFTSNIDIDREICIHDEWFRNLNQSYRRRCITNNVGKMGYMVYTTGNRGKKTFKLVEDREIVREKLHEFTVHS
jgi:hypothetical protein